MIFGYQKGPQLVGDVQAQRPPFNWSPVIAAGVAGGFSALGQERANRMNLRIAREQMDFQRKMSNTAYRRAMRDMRLAGLNPMLAYAQGGASTPGGASAQMESSIGAGVNSAMAFRRLAQDLNESESRETLMDRQADHERGKMNLTGAQRDYYKALEKQVEQAVEIAKADVAKARNMEKAEKEIPHILNLIRTMTGGNVLRPLGIN